MVFEACDRVIQMVGHQHSQNNAQSPQSQSSRSTLKLTGLASRVKSIGELVLTRAAAVCGLFPPSRRSWSSAPSPGTRGIAAAGRFEQGGSPAAGPSTHPPHRRPAEDLGKPRSNSHSSARNLHANTLRKQAFRNVHSFPPTSSAAAPLSHKQQVAAVTPPQRQPQPQAQAQARVPRQQGQAGQQRPEQQEQQQPQQHLEQLQQLHQQQQRQQQQLQRLQQLQQQQLASAAAAEVVRRASQEMACGPMQEEDQGNRAHSVVETDPPSSGCRNDSPAGPRVSLTTDPEQRGTPGSEAVAHQTPSGAAPQAFASASTSPHDSAPATPLQQRIQLAAQRDVLLHNEFERLMAELARGTPNAERNPSPGRAAETSLQARSPSPASVPSANASSHFSAASPSPQAVLGEADMADLLEAALGFTASSTTPTAAKASHPAARKLDNTASPASRGMSPTVAQGQVQSTPIGLAGAASPSTEFSRSLDASPIAVGAHASPEHGASFVPCTHGLLAAAGLLDSPLGADRSDLSAADSSLLTNGETPEGPPAEDAPTSPAEIPPSPQRRTDATEPTEPTESTERSEAGEQHTPPGSAKEGTLVATGEAGPDVSVGSVLSPDLSIGSTGTPLSKLAEANRLREEELQRLEREFRQQEQELEALRQAMAAKGVNGSLDSVDVSAVSFTGLSVSSLPPSPAAEDAAPGHAQASTPVLPGGFAQCNASPSPVSCHDTSAVSSQSDASWAPSSAYESAASSPLGLSSVMSLRGFDSTASSPRRGAGGKVVDISQDSSGRVSCHHSFASDVLLESTGQLSSPGSHPEAVETPHGQLQVQGAEPFHVEAGDPLLESLVGGSSPAAAVGTPEAVGSDAEPAEAMQAALEALTIGEPIVVSESVGKLLAHCDMPQVRPSPHLQAHPLACVLSPGRTVLRRTH